MEFHLVATCYNCVISRAEYSFRSHQAVMIAVGRKVWFLSTNLISFGTANVKKQEHQATLPLRTKEVLKKRLGCHTCNWPCRHPVNKHPAVRPHQVPLLKWKIFRVDRANRSKHDPLHSGRGPLALTEVQDAHLQCRQREKETVKRHT
jgi:hypothetical protein